MSSQSLSVSPPWKLVSWARSNFGVHSTSECGRLSTRVTDSRSSALWLTTQIRTRPASMRLCRWWHLSAKTPSHRNSIGTLPKTASRSLALQLSVWSCYLVLLQVLWPFKNAFGKCALTQIRHNLPISTSRIVSKALHPRSEPCQRTFNKSLSSLMITSVPSAREIEPVFFSSPASIATFARTATKSQQWRCSVASARKPSRRTSRFRCHELTWLILVLTHHDHHQSLHWNENKHIRNENLQYGSRLHSCSNI